MNVATEEELNRAARQRADPEARFHYRYQAAFLAWEAARLMPDHSEETARVLCTAGSWLKLRDPATADIFYKALVRRCRRTAIGEQADRMRWFPVLDEAGNPRPYQPRRALVEKTEIPSESSEPSVGPVEIEPVSGDDPIPGQSYVIMPGDSLAVIARAASIGGVTVTVEQIIESNPGLDVTRLKVGQRIMIPGASLDAGSP